MYYLKLSFILLGFLFFTSQLANAQVTAGLYTNGTFTQIGIGSNPEKKFFGEGRLFAGDYLINSFGFEALGQYNFQKSDWVNISGGLMLGYYEYVEGIRAGIPLLLAIKPIQNNRKFSVMLEATPMYGHEMLALRGNFGLRYTLGGQ
ncbi:hypothetical protein IFO69_12810 [Echinicola sp. CAU 1574]|uniref:Uncharacterized protein n=1 Tax=Echinicola arenosa TaxID=2774144 RepID=A0ABR9ALF1_9BACT|nr:hypothetical protein [Echinicola arenosa]MBD8489629.1 hypothetical protein [Echinicola arenosa]